MHAPLPHRLCGPVAGTESTLSHLSGEHRSRLGISTSVFWLRVILKTTSTSDGTSSSFCFHYWCSAMASTAAPLLLSDVMFRSTPASWTNKAGLRVCTPVHKTFFWFQQNFVCVVRGSATWRYAVWPDPRSRYGGPKVAKIADFKVYLICRCMQSKR